MARFVGSQLSYLLHGPDLKFEYRLPVCMRSQKHLNSGLILIFSISLIYLYRHHSQRLFKNCKHHGGRTAYSLPLTQSPTGLVLHLRTSPRFNLHTRKLRYSFAWECQIYLSFRSLRPLSLRNEWCGECGSQF